MKYRINLAAVIEERDGFLIQKDNTGRVRGRIDLGRTYRVTKPYVAYGDSIFKAQQDDQVLEFCARTPNSEHIAMDVLKETGEWPPVPKWNYPW